MVTIGYYILMEKEIEEIINEDNREREGGKRLLPERERELVIRSPFFP